jgi:hypothetical protein
MKEGVGCLKVVMGGAAAATNFIRLDATAIDLSSTMGKVIIPLFIPTPSAGAVASVSFNVGSDATLAANWAIWTVATQWDGSALATNAWNYVVVDLSVAPTSTNGTPVYTAVKSIAIVINGTSAAMQLSGVFLDYLTLQKPSVVSTVLDYEGTFPYLDIGSSTIAITDELTSRNITITGAYSKRYL